MNLAEVVNSPDLAENFVIMRSVVQYVAGGVAQSGVTTFTAYGVVSQADRKDLDVIPEADRVTEARVFHSDTQMYVTAANGTAAGNFSDILTWQGVQYRVMNVRNYVNRDGYYHAIATRILGA